MTTTNLTRPYEILPPADKNVTHAIIAFKDGKRPHQAIVSKEVLNGKKEEKMHKVFYGKTVIFENTNWKLCSLKEAEFRKLPQYQKLELKTI